MPDDIAKWVGVPVTRPFEIVTTAGGWSGWARKPKKFQETWDHSGQHSEGGIFLEKGTLKIRLKNLLIEELLLKPHKWKDHVRALRRLFFHELAHMKDADFTDLEALQYGLAERRSYADYYFTPTETVAHLAEYNELLDFIKEDELLKRDLLRDLEKKPLSKVIEMLFLLIEDRSPYAWYTTDPKLIAPYLAKLIELKKTVKNSQNKTTKKYKKAAEDLKAIKNRTFQGFRSEMKAIGRKDKEALKVGLATKTSTRAKRNIYLYYLSKFSITQLEKLYKNIQTTFPRIQQGIFQMLQEKDLLPERIYGQTLILRPSRVKLKRLKAKQAQYSSFSQQERRIIRSLQDRFSEIEKEL